MFSIHRFFYKPVLLSESDCVPNANLVHFQDLEKSKVALDYVLPSPQKPYIQRKKQQLVKTAVPYPCSRVYILLRTYYHQ